MPEPNFYEPGLDQGEDIDEMPYNHARTLAEWLNERDEDENNT